MISIQTQLVEARRLVKVAIDDENKHASTVSSVKQQFDQSETRFVPFVMYFEIFQYLDLRLKEKKAKLNACDKELQELNSQVNDLVKVRLSMPSNRSTKTSCLQAKADSELELKKIEHKMARCQGDKKTAAKTVRTDDIVT